MTSASPRVGTTASVTLTSCWLSASSPSSVSSSPTQRKSKGHVHGDLELDRVLDDRPGRARGADADVLNEASFGDHDPSPSEVADLTWQGKTLLMRAHELGAAGSP